MDKMRGMVWCQILGSREPRLRRPLSRQHYGKKSLASGYTFSHQHGWGKLITEGKMWADIDALDLAVYPTSSHQNVAGLFLIDRVIKFFKLFLAFMENFRLRCCSFVQGRKRRAMDVRTARDQYLSNPIDI
jgi:hypothetical protein